MIKYESFCIDCEYCRGSACQYNRAIAVHYCDKCGDAIDDENIYDVDGEELCESCLLDKFRRG